MVFTLGLEKKRGQEIVENLILFLVKNVFCKKTIVIQKYIETKDCFEMNVPLKMTFARPFLAIFLPYVCSSFTKLRL